MYNKTIKHGIQGVKVMVEVNTNVSAKHGSEIVSADVTLYNDENVIVKKICITDESTLK